MVKREEGSGQLPPPHLPGWTVSSPMSGDPPCLSGWHSLVSAETLALMSAYFALSFKKLHLPHL